MKLLLAEDERALSNVLVTILRHSGYTVDAVYNGADALDYLACGAYDGVILDIMMPKVDGIEVLRTIRAAGNKVPVLLLTAKSDVDDKVAGLDCGADDYLKSRSSQRSFWRGCAPSRADRAARATIRSYTATCASTARALSFRRQAASLRSRQRNFRSWRCS